MPERDVRHTPGVRLTYADLIGLPEDGLRHELIDGEHYVTPAPGTPHQTIAFNLSGLFWTYLEAHPIGRALAAPFDVVFTDHDVVEPDLVYFSNECAARQLTPGFLGGAPELIVEIESPSTKRRDQTLKRALYERMGVSEYWLIEPTTATVTVYARPRPDAEFAAATVLPPPDTLTTPLLPGLVLPLTKVFKGSTL